MIASILIVLICSIPLAAGFTAAEHWHWHLTSAHHDIDKKLEDRLTQLGARALRGGDEPAGALVLYGSRTLGAGYNTVVSDTCAAGHAEINAISAAMRRLGPRAFAKLDRDSLTLVTTLEPCPMCRGAILGCGIRHVIFLKGRPLLARMREDLDAMFYEWRRTQRGPASLEEAIESRRDAAPHGRSRS